MSWYLIIWLVTTTLNCDPNVSQRVVNGTFATMPACEAAFTSANKVLAANQTISHICVSGTGRPT